MNSTPSSDTIHTGVSSPPLGIRVELGGKFTALRSLFPGNGVPAAKGLVSWSPTFFFLGGGGGGGWLSNAPSLDVEGNDEECGDRGQLPRDETARAGEIDMQVAVLPHDGGGGRGEGGAGEGGELVFGWW